jgi:hypothetical protein
MPVPGQPTDGDLLAAFMRGDGQAFATFYRRHLPAVVGMLLRETGDREVTRLLGAGRAAVRQSWSRATPRPTE